jgi:hypothetical protein
LEQWTDSITAVLDDLDSREAVVLAIDGAFATGEHGLGNSRALPGW